MKSSLREIVKKRRATLSRDDILQKSETIIATLTSFPPFKKAENILFYVSVNTEVFTHTALKEFIPKKNIFVPYIKQGEIRTSKLNSFDDLEKGTFDILEPKKETRNNVDPQRLDVIIVPGVAFDRKGNRIGYGKGFYDRFLEKTNAVKVGLAFDIQLVDHIDAEKFDVKMDYVITEKAKVVTL